MFSTSQKAVDVAHYSLGAQWLQSKQVFKTITGCVHADSLEKLLRLLNAIIDVVNYTFFCLNTAGTNK